MTLTPDHVFSVVISGDPTTLVGSVETALVDFKSEPYQLHTARQKHELAKDVAAFANASGGIIAIGFRTEKVISEATDRVIEVRPFLRKLVNAEQWRKTIHDRVYPRLLDIEIHWRPLEDGSGLVAIRIPAQPVSARPFLVHRMPSEGDENKLDGSYVALFERRHTEALPHSVYDVQGLMRDGLAYRRAIDGEEGPSRPSGMSATVATLPKHKALPPAATDMQTATRLGRLRADLDLESEPLYVLLIVPTSRVSAVRMFENEDNEITRLLLNPPHIRENGFDLETGAYPHIVDGLARQAVRPGYKGLSLQTNGTLLFAARGDEEFLSWGDRAADRPYVLNPLVLAESVYLFSELAVQLYNALGGGDTLVRAGLQLRDMCVTNRRPVLAHRVAGPYSLAGSRHEGPDCSCSFWEDGVAAQNPGVRAYKLLAQLYRWFGWAADRMPYVEHGPDGPRISRDDLDPDL